MHQSCLVAYQWSCEEADAMVAIFLSWRFLRDERLRAQELYIGTLWPINGVYLSSVILTLELVPPRRTLTRFRSLSIVPLRWSFFCWDFRSKWDLVIFLILREARHDGSPQRFTISLWNRTLRFARTVCYTDDNPWIRPRQAAPTQSDTYTMVWKQRPYCRRPYGAIGAAPICCFYHGWGRHQSPFVGLQR